MLMDTRAPEGKANPRHSDNRPPSRFPAVGSSDNVEPLFQQQRGHVQRTADWPPSHSAGRQKKVRQVLGSGPACVAVVTADQPPALVGIRFRLELVPAQRQGAGSVLINPPEPSGPPNRVISWAWSCISRLESYSRRRVLKVQHNAEDHWRAGGQTTPPERLIIVLVGKLLPE